VPVEDRWDISDDPEPFPPAADLPSVARVDQHIAQPSDPMRSTLTLGALSLPAPLTDHGASAPRPPSSAPGPSGGHREAPPTPTLALESKGLRELLAAKAAEAGVLPPSVAKGSSVHSATLVHEHPKASTPSSPPLAPPSAGVMSAKSVGATSGVDASSATERPTTMMFSASEIADAAKSATSAASGAALSAKGASRPVGEADLRGTLIMAPPVVAETSTASSSAHRAPKSAVASKGPRNPLASTIVGVGIESPTKPEASLEKAPVAAARPGSPASKPPAQTLVGVAALGAGSPKPEALPSLQSTLVHSAPPPAASVQPDARSAPIEHECAETPLASSKAIDDTASSARTDLSMKTATTPLGFAATLEHPPVAERAADAEGVPSAERADARRNAPTTASDLENYHNQSTSASVTQGSRTQPPSSAVAETKPAVVDEQPETGEPALRVALAAAGTVVVASAIPALLSDPIAAATWTIPGVIALVMAFVAVGHATRALLAFAPALPALAVRAMACEGYSVLGALSLTSLVTLMPAALLYRAQYPRTTRGRILLAAAIVVGVGWALLPGGGATLRGGPAPWMAAHLPAFSFAAVAALSATSLFSSRAALAARICAPLAMVWAIVPVLGSRAEQFAHRALDALSLAGLGAIASSSLAALLSVYLAPDERSH
jgi:hypothetical protein